MALNPGTAISALAVVPDLVLCMTVNPGWGGQPFIPGSLRRLEVLRELHGDLPIEVDGGIGPDTARRCKQAGATTFVAGSAVFGADDPGRAVRELASAVS